MGGLEWNWEKANSTITKTIPSKNTRSSSNDNTETLPKVEERNSMAFTGLGLSRKNIIKETNDLHGFPSIFPV